ncbi:olfactory receptor 10AG1-like [Dendropsophus ebraccatus]|uniref:olfactory receptor 10AG1-like n=1 Tax=Dendropsophus ebraccatus TaxID=150705 RepID=UPI003831058D
MQRNFTDFFLLGFTDLPPSTQAILFTFFLCAYFLTIFGNGIIIVTLSFGTLLQTPMYFFLRNLSFHEICLTTSFIPKVLENFLSKDRTISFSGCALQMGIFFTIGISECVFLGIMAFDRYMAICHPLRYPMVMNTKLCYQLTLASWSFGSFVSVAQTWYIFTLPFCRSRRIVHFFCDNPAIIKLACTNTFLINLLRLVSAFCAAGIPFLLILCSYIKILSSILLIHSSEGRHKALSTCSSHLASVFLLYGTVLVTYLKFGTNGSDDNDRMVSLFYCNVIPVVNPLIYSLRNKEMKVAIRKFIFDETNKISY